MVEEKFVVGRFLNFSLATVATKLASPELGTIIDQPEKISSIEQSTTSGVFRRKKTSEVVSGSNQKTKRNFNFLTYYPGIVTQTTLNSDVLTGPMSGCWIMLYRRDGKPRVGHVGTFEGPNTPKSIQAKEAWTQFAGANQQDLIGGFNPFTTWKGKSPTKKDADGNGSVYALVTTARRFYTIFLYKQQGSTTNYRIAGFKEVVSAPPSSLANI